MTGIIAALLLAAADGGVGDAGVEAPEPPKVPFSKQAVLDVVTSKKDQIQACYNDMNANKGGNKVPEGVLKAHWTITKEGIVKGAKIEKKGTTLKDPKLHECVVAVILTMEFPKPPKDTPIDFPFNLKAEKAEK